MIPKRIIQTWKTENLPWRFRNYRKRFKQLNPDFEFILFTDNDVFDFVAREYPDYTEAFNRLPYFIQKIDLFRLLAVHKLGGFYFDLDVYPVKSLDELCSQQCVFPFSRQPDPYFAASHGVVELISNYAFGARAGHPFLLECADNIRDIALNHHTPSLPPKEVLESSVSIFGDLATLDIMMQVFYSTGPLMITKTFLQSREIREDMKVLSAFNRKSSRKLWACFGPYGIHRMSGGWIKSNGLKRKIFSTLWEFISTIGILQKAKILKQNNNPILSSELMEVSQNDRH